VISHIREATTAKRMDIDPHCQRQYYKPIKCTFQRYIHYVDIAGRSSAKVYSRISVDENGDYQPIYAIIWLISHKRQVIRLRLLLTINRKSHIV